MSAYDEHEYDESNNGPRALREALEKANKRVSELEKANSDLTAKVSQFSLASVLAEKKVPGNIAKWLKRDNVEPTAEAVDKWLEENGADFGWKPGAQEASEGATAEEAPAQGQQAPQSVLTPEEQAQYQLAQAAMSGASGAPGQPLDAMNAAVEQIAAKNLSWEDTIRALAEAGIPISGEVKSY